MQKSFWMLLAAFLFASMAAFTKMGAREFDVMELVFYRSIFGVVCIFIWTLFKGLSVATPLIGSHLKRSFLGTMGLTIWFFAISQLPLGTAMTLNYTSPLYIAAILTGAALWKHRPIRLLLVLSVILGFVGVVLVLKPSLNHGQELAALIGLSSGLFAALAYLQVKELSDMKEPEWRIVFYFTCFGSVWGLAIQLMLHGHMTPLTLDNIPVLFGIAVTGTLAQLTMTRSWGSPSPLLTSAFQYSGIIFAAVYGSLFFDEPIGVVSAIGIAIILISGVSASFLSKSKK